MHDFGLHPEPVRPYLRAASGHKLVRIAIACGSIGHPAITAGSGLGSDVLQEAAETGCDPERGRHLRVPALLWIGIPNSAVVRRTNERLKAQYRYWEQKAFGAIAKRFGWV
jgi:hypothetical protein